MNILAFISGITDFLYDGLLWFLDEQSIGFRLLINTVVIILTIHLLIKRLIELRRRDFIFPFRVTWVIAYTVILVFSIPVEWWLITMFMGMENEALQNLARVSGGMVILGFVLLCEVIDIVIMRINKRAKAVEDAIEKKPKH